MEDEPEEHNPCVEIIRYKRTTRHEEESIEDIAYSLISDRSYDISFFPPLPTLLLISVLSRGATHLPILKPNTYLFKQPKARPVLLPISCTKSKVLLDPTHQTPFFKGV